MTTRDKLLRSKRFTKYEKALLEKNLISRVNLCNMSIENINKKMYALETVIPPSDMNAFVQERLIACGPVKEKYVPKPEAIDTSVLSEAPVTDAQFDAVENNVKLIGVKS